MDAQKGLLCEVTRQILYDGNGQPFLSLAPKAPRRPGVQKFAIRKVDLWMYSEDHNPHFVSLMYAVTSNLFRVWDLGIVTTAKMAALAGFIQEGIEDLLRTKPQRFDDALLKQIGEMAITARPVGEDGKASVYNGPLRAGHLMGI
jgi:hypothetical protein